MSVGAAIRGAASRPGRGARSVGVLRRPRRDPRLRARHRCAASAAWAGSRRPSPPPARRPASSSSRMCSTRVPRSTASSSRRCSSGMRLRRSSPRRWRTKGIARPSARRAARRSSGWPMTETHTVAWRRSGVTSTCVMVTKPTRGSWISRAIRALISSRSSSSRRATRSLIGRPSDGRPEDQADAARDTVCWVKHSMMSPSARSWKPARPMPHSKPVATSRTSSRKRRSDSMRSVAMSLPPR